MKLTKSKMLLVSFMLFSLFFGAGNLIFPPFLGQTAGEKTPLALLGFLITAVILPVLGVIVVAKFDGLEKLASKVNSKFAIVFTILIYLSIGPGLGIPRAASVPFEMAIAPYLPSGSSLRLYMLLYSLVFFIIAGWLALTPNKLVDRIGKFLTPSLLILLILLFMSFLFAGKMDVTPAQNSYRDSAFVTGFLEGYNTMDAIAALNFGLVIATTLHTLHVSEKKDIMHYTIRAGIAAGSILAIIYGMLSFMGMQSSGVYELQDNGAWTLRCIVKQVFGNPGAIMLAAIFTLACLTTCVGLITSISQYFSTLIPKIGYRYWVFIIVGFSFAVCNLGLTTILSISVPILNAIYPVAITLIALGLCDKWLKDIPHIYSCTIWPVAIISVIYAMRKLTPMRYISNMFSILPFYSYGMGWVTVAVVMCLVVLIYAKIKALYKVKSSNTAK